MVCYSSLLVCRHDPEPGIHSSQAVCLSSIKNKNRATLDWIMLVEWIAITPLPPSLIHHQLVSSAEGALSPRTIQPGRRHHPQLQLNVEIHWIGTGLIFINFYLMCISTNTHDPRLLITTMYCNCRPCTFREALRIRIITKNTGE